jgi:hypothetical protein
MCVANVSVQAAYFVGTGPSSYKKRTYWAAVSYRLRSTALNNFTGFIEILYKRFPPKFVWDFRFSLTDPYKY